MEKQIIQPFLTVANYRFIEQQAEKILQALATTKDKNVILAVRGTVKSELIDSFTWSDEEEKVVQPLIDIKDRAEGEVFLEQLKPYIIPFKSVGANKLKSLFKKERKLKLPNLEDMDLQQISYLAWDDPGKQRRYMVMEQGEDFKALKGTFTHPATKGICALCNQHTEVVRLTTSVKGEVPGTFTKHYNYICANSQLCNQHVTDIEKVRTFFNRVTK
ncbi:FusB/FusC family EF-G-binding protein [Oceanobacillus jeddahense]|uniref:FusB/FusC family EF-G-binding protein n=1 Tax=Oceanobacillus jeddahense TaxID=1462527 RepID=A0ABY5JTR1_9BACI|nr:FusB/FusC family EF-G-binding protein [Oceanobacillus jeddahense]UUI03660.1 FusB/FusC family EF-G-binding protein [Oceanobacillus jeddahense]